MFDEAVREYQDILEINPSHVNTLFNLGNLHVQLGDCKKAITFFKQVLTFDPNHAEAWNNLGSIYEVMEKYEEAITAYQKSLSLNPLQEEANVNLAQSQYRQYCTNPDESKKEEIIRRLYFVLSINPQKKRAQKLLDELMAGKT
jgi:tetratricopeptide (TPR) repeat protein